MKIKILAAFAAIFISILSVQAQDCFSYLPTEEGTKMESKHFDKDGKETGTSTLTVLKKTETAKEKKIDVSLESTSPQSAETNTMEYSYSCIDGKLYVDMKSFFGATLNQYQGMEVEVDAPKLELPNSPKAGQELPGGTANIQVSNQGVSFIKIEVLISDRKVEKLETLTTPAGTFKCFKITQKTETKLGFIKVKGGSAEWIAEGAGVVKSESYDKKGNLISYTVLNKLTK